MMELAPTIRGLADIEAIERTPLAERLQGLTCTYDVFRRSAARWPDATALVFLPTGSADDEAVEISYPALLAAVTRAANLFHSFGVGRGDAVGVLLPNLPQTHFALWGAETTGVAAPVNPLLEAEHIAGILNGAGAKVLVTLGERASPEIWAKAQAVRGLAPGLAHVLTIGGAGEAGTLDFDRALAEQPADRLVSGRTPESDDVASYFHTGGTTGVPKLAVHTHHNELALSWSSSAGIGTSAGETFVCGLPLFHVNGVFVTGLAPFLVGGRVVIAGPAGFRSPNLIKSFWRVVERFRASYFSAVPTVYAALLETPIDGADVSSLRCGVCGAAPMPVETFRRFEAATGIRILEGYGQTEGTCVTSVNPRDGERRIGSVGIRIPYMGVRTVVLDSAGRAVRDCAADEIGAVAISGPMVIPGYREERANAGLWVADGWLNTGDLGRLDADGYLWLTGRSKELIIRGGHNIDPAVIESALALHPSVSQAAAVGRPDARVGELPVVYVTLRPGSSADAEELKTFAGGHIHERAARPVEVVIADRLPLTAVGKIFKPSLRYDAVRRTLSAALFEALGDGVDVSVDVGPHDRHGTVATVRCRRADGGAVERKAIENALSSFAVHYEIVAD